MGRTHLIAGPGSLLSSVEGCVVAWLSPVVSCRAISLLDPHLIAGSGPWLRLAVGWVLVSCHIIARSGPWLILAVGWVVVSCHLVARQGPWLSLVVGWAHLIA